MVGTEVDAALSLLSCEVDIRVGGGYRLVFGHDGPKTMEFFGKYTRSDTALAPRLDERREWRGGAVTTVTFEEKGGKTLLVLHELYPSKEALDAAMASGATSGMGETFEQLDAASGTTT